MPSCSPSSSSSFSSSGSSESSASCSSDQSSSALLSSVILSRSSSDNNRDVSVGIGGSSHGRGDEGEKANATHHMPLPSSSIVAKGHRSSSSSSSSSLCSAQGSPTSTDHKGDGKDDYREVQDDRLLLRLAVSPPSFPHPTTTSASHQSRQSRRCLSPSEVSTDAVRSHHAGHLLASHSVCDSGEEEREDEGEEGELLLGDRLQKGSRRGQTWSSVEERDKERLAAVCCISSLISTLVSVVDQLQAAGVATVHLPECMMTCQLSLRGRSLPMQVCKKAE